MRRATTHHARIGDAIATGLLDRTVTFKSQSADPEADPEASETFDTTLYSSIAARVSPLNSTGEIKGGQVEVATREYKILANGWLSSLKVDCLAVLDDDIELDILRVERIGSANLTHIVARRRR